MSALHLRLLRTGLPPLPRCCTTTPPLLSAARTTNLGTRPARPPPPRRLKSTSARGRLSRREQQRNVVTASVEAPLSVPNDPSYFERPGSVALLESRLCIRSWDDAFKRTFPRHGLRYDRIDPFIDVDAGEDSTATAGVATLQRLETALAADLCRDGSSSSHTLLVARGPVPSLLAQYYLESLPLAGVVLVDPCVVPDDGGSRPSAATAAGGDFGLGGTGDGHQDFSRTRETASAFLDLLAIDSGKSNGQMRKPPFAHPDDATAEVELSVLRSISGGQHDRPLLLEPGSVPMLVLYSAGHAHEDAYRVSAERSAAFHTPLGGGLTDDDESGLWGHVAVLKVNAYEASGEDNLGKILEDVVDWFDEHVA